MVQGSRNLNNLPANIEECLSLMSFQVENCILDKLVSLFIYFFYVCMLLFGLLKMCPILLLFCTSSQSHLDTHQSGVAVPSPASAVLREFILTLSLFLSAISKLAQQGLGWH